MAPWGRLSGFIFSSLKNSKLSFYRVLLGGGHLRPLREKGGTRRQGARGGPEEAGIEKVDRRLQPNAKVPFIFSILRGVFGGRYHELSICTANNHAR